MNRCLITIASALVLADALPMAQARMKSSDEPPSTQARTAFRQIEESAADMRDVTQQLGRMAQETTYQGQEPAFYLNTLKQDVNQIGAQLRTLDAERSSLEPWEAEALDKVLPLMNDAARETEKAVNTFNSERNHLWATDYPREMKEVDHDAAQVKTTIGEYLKLAKTHAKEQRLEHVLGNPTGL